MASEFGTNYINLAKFPWDNKLTQLLESGGWEFLWDEHGISYTEYSTNNLVCQTPHDRLQQAEEWKYINISDRQIVIDALSPLAIQRFEGNGLKILGQDRISKWASECIEQAIEKYIARVPVLYQSVQKFVRCIHLLDAGDDAYDVSFSDPDIPFSIFVSVSNRYEEKSVWRVVESIVHETLHLQLTLLERFVPLIRLDHSGASYYSPWKSEKREARGILHAIYVFTVILQYWNTILKMSDDVDLNKFVCNRIKEIETELLEVRGFTNSEDLTPEGKMFVRTLFSELTENGLNL